MTSNGKRFTPNRLPTGCLMQDLQPATPTKPLSRSKWRLALAATLILAVQAPLATAPRGPFEVIEGTFDGDDKALVWNARLRDSQESGQAPYLVAKSYGAQTLPGPQLEREEKVLHEAEVSLPDGKRAVVRLLQRPAGATTAAPNQQIRLVFTYQLEAGRRLFIRREQPVTINGSVPAAGEERSIFANLEGDARRVALALADNDSSELEGSRLVQLAIWLLTTERPLGRPSKKLVLQKCRGEIGGKPVELALEKNSLGVPVVRLPAKTGTSIVLRPSVQIKEYTAYSNTVVIKQKPLPSYAFVRLVQPGGSLRSFGTATQPPGTFEIGPFQPSSLRALEITAAFPLEPPGEHPRLRAEVVFRNGRPIESHLDKGELPPAPKVPRSLAAADVVDFTVTLAGAAVNPDTGSIRGVGYRHLVDLYAIAFASLKDYPDLHAIAEQALLKDIARRSWTYPRKELSAGRGWTLEDAEIVLAYPTLSAELAAKLKQEPEPREWSKKTASKRSGRERKVIALDSPDPHAWAAAALSRKPELDQLVRAQLSLLQGHLGRQKQTWSTDQIVRAGQPLKFTIAHSKSPETKKLAGELLRQLRRLAHRRYVEDQTLALADRVQLAHLISAVWRPYLKTPPRLLVESLEIEPAGKPTQDSHLIEMRLRFRAALMREAQELVGKKVPAEEKTRRLGALAERWLTYIEKNRGTLPPEFRQTLDTDYKLALERAAKQ